MPTKKKPASAVAKPRAKGPRPRAAETAPAPAPRRAGGKGELVLVVDDYEDARIMYSEYLEFAGFRTVTAANGIEAIEAVARDRPAVVLMDLSMPVLDGWEATRRIKADASLRATYIVGLTGHVLPSELDRARAAGVDDIITKPVLPEVLTQKVVTAIAKRRRSPTRA